MTPSVVGRSVFFARTNDGSGQGNNLFRLDLRTKKLFAARGTSRAESVTWLGDRFLMSRNSGGCIGPPDMDPDRDADLRARGHGPAGVQEGVEGGPAQDRVP